MPNFDSLDDLANHLAMAVVPNIPTALKGGLEEVGKAVEARAKAKFGIYQKGVYKYPRWAQLSESTINNGNPDNTPLLRTGTDRDSISHFINGNDLVVGSDQPDMVYHEVGTKTEPPRPVLGPALYESKDLIRNIMAKATVIAIVPNSEISKALGFRRTGAHITSDRYDDYRE